MAEDISENIVEAKSWTQWKIPADFISNRAIMHGHDQVYTWLNDCSALAQQCADDWQLTIECFMPGGSLSLPLACTDAARHACVLKLTAPWARTSPTHERDALAAWKGQGAPRLLASTVDARAILMERVFPGQVYETSEADAVAVRKTAETLNRLRTSGPEGLLDLSHTINTRFTSARKRLLERPGWLEAAELDQAQDQALELAAAGSRQLVHGDFQLKNLLVGHDGRLIAIDPLPAIGDITYDAGLWAATYRPGQQVAELSRQLARQLDINPGQVLSWAVVLMTAEVMLDRPERASAHLAGLRAITS